MRASNALAGALLCGSLLVGGLSVPLEALATPAPIPDTARLSDPAAAQTQAAANLDLASQMVEKLFKLGDMRTVIGKAAADSFGAQAGFAARPQWRRLMLDAVLEEVDQGPFRQKLAGYFADYFTKDELVAGLATMSGKSGDYMVRAAIEQRAGRPAPLPTADETRALRKVMSNPAAQAWGVKMKEIQGLMKQHLPELLDAMMPGLLRRFADKIEADAKARAGQGG